jgi:hypothetical protein
MNRCQLHQRGVAYLCRMPLCSRDCAGFCDSEECKAQHLH